MIYCLVCKHPICPHCKDWCDQLDCPCFPEMECVLPPLATCESGNLAACNGYVINGRYDYCKRRVDGFYVTGFDPFSRYLSVIVGAPCWFRGCFKGLRQVFSAEVYNLGKTHCRDGMITAIVKVSA